MPATFFVQQNDPAISKLFWPSFTETLQEKHGKSGEKGSKGEENAAKILCDDKYFPELVVVIKNEDALSQLIGVDYTTVAKNGKVNYIDVKSGASALYWTKDQGWYLTFNKKWYSNPNKKTDYFMHVGPKGDVFAAYYFNEFLEWIIKNKEKLTEYEYGVKLNKKDWPSNLIYTNLK